VNSRCRRLNAWNRPVPDLKSPRRNCVPLGRPSLLQASGTYDETVIHRPDCSLKMADVFEAESAVAEAEDCFFR
jgi:hypothetical protein